MPSQQSHKQTPFMANILSEQLEDQFSDPFMSNQERA